MRIKGLFLAVVIAVMAFMIMGAAPPTADHPNQPPGLTTDRHFGEDVVNTIALCIPTTVVAIVQIFVAPAPTQPEAANASDTNIAILVSTNANPYTMRPVPKYFGSTNRFVPTRNTGTTV